MLFMSFCMIHITSYYYPKWHNYNFITHYYHVLQYIRKKPRYTVVFCLFTMDSTCFSQNSHHQGTTLLHVKTVLTF